MFLTKLPHLLVAGGWWAGTPEGCRPGPNAAEATCSGASWALRPPCCCCLRAFCLCSGGRSQTRQPRRSSCPEEREQSARSVHLQPLPQHARAGHTRLLVQFERVAERVQALRLLGVRVPQGLRGRFEEVLVVAHLGYWHAVELVWKRQQISVTGPL